jgi:hypothetical protein
MPPLTGDHVRAMATEYTALLERWRQLAAGDSLTLEW